MLAPGSDNWRRAVDERAVLAEDSDDGRRLCLATFDGALELWDLASSRQLFRAAADDVERLAATPFGCLALTHGEVRLYAEGAAPRLVATGAAMAWDGGEVLVAENGRIAALDAATGAERAAWPGGIGVTALARTKDYLVVGYENGTIDLLPRTARGTRPNFAFEDVPASPVMRFVEGPMGTLIAGYANGVLGIWNLENGSRMDGARLHGAVSHILLSGGRLIAATELGDTLTMDLSAFHVPYCELMRTIWSDVPVVWEGGLPVARAAPADHPCLR